MLEEGFLKVSDIHSIYYAVCGNKKGIPVLFVHGGPGGCSSGLNDIDGLDFDRFFYIVYDQRGCGKSIPNGELKDNTTNEAISDIKKLLDYLNIKKVIISASSWGACLSLIFSENYPNMVKNMFLRSTFLATENEINWLYNESYKIFPDLYEKFMKPIISESKKDNIAKYLLEKMNNSNYEEKGKIACFMANYEHALMLMTFSNSNFKKPEDLEENDINSTKLFLHYESNHYFIENDYIIKNADKIKNIPIIFYHGRFDMNCTINNVYELHKILPNSKLIIVPYESHSGILLKDLQRNDIKDFGQICT
ncbi:MAG TPA: alpha/beta fold hydrolase [Rickettsiales bacterium]|nr:alpha/beta fold hydrolase [Rickettsiales bacterium]